MGSSWDAPGFVLVNLEGVMKTRQGMIHIEGRPLTNSSIGCLCADMYLFTNGFLTRQRLRSWGASCEYLWYRFAGAEREQNAVLLEAGSAVLIFKECL
jgi:hypothetical protein